MCYIVFLVLGSIHMLCVVYLIKSVSLNQMFVVINVTDSSLKGIGKMTTFFYLFKQHDVQEGHLRLVKYLNFLSYFGFGILKHRY